MSSESGGRDAHTTGDLTESALVVWWWLGAIWRLSASVASAGHTVMLFRWGSNS